MSPSSSLHRYAWMLRSAAVLTAVAAFIGISAWAYLPWWELAFRSDASPVSWLSSALLFACAALAFKVGAQGGLSRGLAAWLVVALLVMALDEQFMFHEYWKYHCADWLAWCGRPVPGRVAWLGDAPMMLVGVVGSATLVWLYRASDTAAVRGLLVAAVAVGVVLALGTHFGHASGLLPAWFNRFEEPFETVAVALFLCALLEMPAARK
jgi:hypothetical protein